MKYNTKTAQALTISEHSWTKKINIAGDFIKFDLAVMMKQETKIIGNGVTEQRWYRRQTAK